MKEQKQINISLFDQEKERSALGAITLNPSFLKKAQDFLGSVQVFSAVRKTIFEKMLIVKLPWDAVILRAKLPKEAKSEFTINVMSSAMAIPWPLLRRYLEELKILAVKRAERNLLQGLNQANDNGKDALMAGYEYMEGLTRLEEIEKEKTKTFFDFEKEGIPDITCLIGRGLLSTVGYLLLAGKKGMRKTTVALSIAWNIVTGSPVFLRKDKDPACSFPIERKGKVLYLYIEGQPGFILNILAKQKEALEKLLGRKITDKEQKSIAIERVIDVFLDTPEGLSSLEKKIQSDDYVLVILDPLTRLVTSDINKGVHATPVVAALNNLSLKHNVSFLVCHHIRKGGEKESLDPMDDILGSVVLYNGAESVIRIARHRQDKTNLMKELRFEVRNAAQINPLTILLDPDSFLPHYITEAEEVTTAAVTAETLADFITKAFKGKPARASNVVDLAKKHYEVSKSRIYQVFAEGEADGILGKDKQGRWYVLGSQGKLL